MDEKEINKPWVYILGPYTKGYVVYNTRKAMKYFNKLLETKIMTPIVPHWTMFQDLVFPRKYGDWLSYDSEIIRKCDAGFRIEGESNGADKEEHQLTSAHKPVFLEKDYDDLVSWANWWISKKAH